MKPAVARLAPTDRIFLLTSLAASSGPFFSILDRVFFSRYTLVKAITTNIKKEAAEANLPIPINVKTPSAPTLEVLNSVFSRHRQNEHHYTIRNLRVKVSGRSFAILRGPHIPSFSQCLLDFFYPMSALFSVELGILQKQLQNLGGHQRRLSYP